MSGPLPFDLIQKLKSPPSSLPTEDEEQSVTTGPLDMDLIGKLARRERTPAETGQELVEGIKSDAIARIGQPVVAPYDASVFTRRQAVPQDQPTFEELVGIKPPAQDVTAMQAVKGIGRPGEARSDRLQREQLEYIQSPEGIREQMASQQGTISEAPSGFAKFRQNLGNMRVFTDRSIVEFDQGNSSGFHIGLPFAHPVETAKQLAVGLPHFFADLVRQPFYLAVDKLEPGSGYLLPEEREQYQREVIANYAGLVVGASAGAVVKELRIGRDLLKAGAGAAERAGIAVPVQELELIAGTLPKALQVESTIPGQIVTGITEGVTGGATTGMIQGRTPEERRNLAATYALMAIPAGVAFEGIMGRVRGQKLGFHGASAVHAHGLSVLRQMQDAAKQSEANARGSFLALRGANDLAEAAQRTAQNGVENPIIIQGVTEYKPNGTEIVHTRPDGTMDVAFGIPDIAEIATDVEISNIVAAQRPPSGMTPEYIAMNDARVQDISARTLRALNEYHTYRQEVAGGDYEDATVREMSERYQAIHEELKTLPMDYRVMQMRRAQQAADIALQRYKEVRDVKGINSEEAQTARYRYLDKLQKIDETSKDYNVSKPGLTPRQKERDAEYDAAGIRYSPPRGPELPFLDDPRVKAKIVEIQSWFDENLGRPRNLPRGAGLEEVLRENAERTAPRDKLMQELADLIPDDQLRDYFDPGPNLPGSHTVDELLHQAWFRKFDPGTGGPHIVSFAKTGKDKVGATMDKSLLKKLGANMYKSGISSVIVKEGIQNAVDAIRPTGGKGEVFLDIDPEEGVFKIEDTGIGMTPEVAANQFMDVGGSAKPGGASGGYGLAKVGLLSNAEYFIMTTVAETPEGKKRTTIQGTSDDWVAGTLEYKVEGVNVIGSEAETGTKLHIRVPKEMASKDSWQARTFLANVQKYNRGDAARIHRERGYGYKQEPTKEGDRIETENAVLEMHHALKMEEKGQYDQLEIHVLNNGLYQFTSTQSARGVVPEFIVVDVKSKVGVESDQYPFTTSREELKGVVAQAVKDYVGELSILAAKDEALGLIEAIREAPRLGEDTDLRVMDTSRKLDPKVIQTVLNDHSTARIADTYDTAIHNIGELLQQKIEQIQTQARRPLNNFVFAGIGIGKGYLGLNISSEALNNIAKAARVPETGISQNIILVNPYATYMEALRADNINPNSGISLAERMADNGIGTLIHEVVHEIARGHDESFSGALTRAIGIVINEGGYIRNNMLAMWEQILKPDILTGESQFEMTFNTLARAWEKADDNAFKSISSDQATGEHDVGGPLRRDEGGEQLPARSGDSPISSGVGPRSSQVVPGSEQLTGQSAGAEPPGALERRRAHAAATFQVAGFFPNEVVGFLGSEYTYIEPVIGKNGVLEGHIIRDSDGNRIEVPWKELRHGPDMAVNTFLFDKPAARKAIVKDFDAWVKKNNGESLPNQPFDDMVAAFVANKNYNRAMISPLMNFLSNEYGRMLRDEALSPEEKAHYIRLTKEASKYKQESGSNLVDAATSNGMYIERQNGALIIRDSATGAYLELAHSPEEALAFVNSVSETRGPDLTPPGGLPPGVAGGLVPVPPPPGGPHTSAWNPRANGWVGELRDAFNVSGLGSHFTGMRQVMISLDNQLGTRYFAEVYQPLQVAHLRKYSAMHKDMLRVAETSRLLRGLSEEQAEQITTAIETMHPDDMIKAGGLFNRAFTPRELAGAKWFIENQIDIKKAFQYHRALRNLERKKSYQTLPEGEKIEPVHRLQASLNMDEAHLEAARIMGAVLRYNKPGELSLYGIVRLAEAVMDGHMRPDDYMAKAFPPANTPEGAKMRQARTEISAHFRDLADTFSIPDEQRLGGYFAHLRNFANDEIVAGQDGAPIFTSELLRTGEMSEYDRDPINVLVRYINSGYSNKFTKESLDHAYMYLGRETARMTDPAQGDYVQRLITENYINELRGIPHASSSFAEKIFNNVLDRLGVKSEVSVRRDIVNTFLSLTSSAAIGFRPMQGIRDFHNLSSIYYSRFGAKRLANMYSIMARVTPKNLEDAGIITKSMLGEGPSAAMAREGVTPTLAPVSVLTAQERLQNTIAARTAPFRAAIQATADAGIKWGLQHNVYQWAHAASYLESSMHAMEELNNLASGKYGSGAEAKQKAYDNIFLNSYDPPVAREFDRLVTEGKFKDAADLIGRSTSFETVSTFGLANHPAGWGTNTGRLFGQFGNWPVWARTTLARMATRGTRQERTRVAVRWGMTQGALAGASAALGLNLNSWYLPGAAPLFSAGQHLGAAAESYDEEQIAEMQKAAAAIVLGVPGSMMFRGGPAFGVVGSAVDAGSGYERGVQDAASSLTRLPMLGVPGSYLLRDIFEGAKMAENGDNPVSAWLRAFGVRSTEDESLLNPGGIVVE